MDTVARHNATHQCDKQAVYLFVSFSALTNVANRPLWYHYEVYRRLRLRRRNSHALRHNIKAIFHSHTSVTTANERFHSHRFTTLHRNLYMSACP